MIEATIGDIPVITPLLVQCFAETGIEKRFPVDQCLAWVQGGLESRRTKLFVDEIGNPSCIVYLLTDSASMFPGEKPLTVILIYALPEKRNYVVFKKMNRVIEGEAERMGKNSIYASEWCWGTSPEIGQLWEQLGYKLQEKVYVQHLD